MIEAAPDGAVAAAGPDSFRLSTPRDLRIHAGTVTAEFEALEGARERCVLGWHPSWDPALSAAAARR